MSKLPKSKNLHIIGNGFDLYLGLKTSYNNFFQKFETTRNQIQEGIKIAQKKYETNLNGNLESFSSFNKAREIIKELNNEEKRLLEELSNQENFKDNV